LSLAEKEQRKKRKRERREQEMWTKHLNSVATLPILLELINKNDELISQNDRSWAEAEELDILLDRHEQLMEKKRVLLEAAEEERVVLLQEVEGEMKNGGESKNKGGMKRQYKRTRKYRIKNRYHKKIKKTHKK
jgi:hypothetical protein